MQLTDTHSTWKHGYLVESWWYRFPQVQYTEDDKRESGRGKTKEAPPASAQETRRHHSPSCKKDQNSLRESLSFCQTPSNSQRYGKRPATECMARRKRNVERGTETGQPKEQRGGAPMRKSHNERTENSTQIVPACYLRSSRGLWEDTWAVKSAKANKVLLAFRQATDGGKNWSASYNKRKERSKDKTDEGLQHERRRRCPSVVCLLRAFCKCCFYCSSLFITEAYCRMSSRRCLFTAALGSMIPRYHFCYSCTDHSASYTHS